jgi:hypothetical protein
MVYDKKYKRLSREDWIRVALDHLITNGVEGVRIVPLAEPGCHKRQFLLALQEPQGTS